MHLLVSTVHGVCVITLQMFLWRACARVCVEKPSASDQAVANRDSWRVCRWIRQLPWSIVVQQCFENEADASFDYHSYPECA